MLGLLLLQIGCCLRQKKIPFIISSKSELCATLREKLEIFYTNVEDVEGDMRKVRMKLKDRKELCVETHVELVRSLASVIAT